MIRFWSGLVRHCPSAPRERADAGCGQDDCSHHADPSGDKTVSDLINKSRNRSHKKRENKKRTWLNFNAYGNSLDIGNWSCDCCLDGGKSVKDARQNKQTVSFNSKPSQTPAWRKDISETFSTDGFDYLRKLERHQNDPNHWPCPFPPPEPPKRETVGNIHAAFNAARRKQVAQIVVSKTRNLQFLASRGN